ncbi:hypothetical protein WA026_007507 [Henosepilachna vigintioctopunctata]|uniref:RNA helicase n=1 Tax=Henosepilachna vigintioctopunctata TaxID=420089 RepID=A0AAW1UQ41_9CUCU
MASLDFVWNNNQSKVTGTFFAKKRRLQGKTAEKTTINFLNSGDKEKVSEKQNFNKIETSTNPSTTRNTEHVKKKWSNDKTQNRDNDAENTNANLAKDKNKKDKRAAATVLKSGQTPTDHVKKKWINDDRTENREDDTENIDRRLVKRKNKKDKLAAAALLKSGQKPAPIQKDKFTHSLFSEKYKMKSISNVPGVSVVEKVFSSNCAFKDLDIHKYIVSNLEKHGFTTLTNVQEKAIPVMLKGQNVLIRSQTGSGKTLAYAVPILDALQSITPRLERNHGVQAIIVVPTRELALQTHEIISKICTFQWIVVGHLCGGENRNTEKTRLRKGTHILIATPGRLLDHILHTSSFKINNVRCLVLDEADRLLDMGFKKDIVKIVEELDKSKKNDEYDPMAMLRGDTSKEVIDENEPDTSYCLRDPKNMKRQNVLLSATLTKGIAELAEFTMKDHIYIDALAEDLNINPNHMVIPKTVRQEYIITFVKHRLFTLASILVAKSKENCKILVFMATSQMVDFHYELFSKYLAILPFNRGKLNSGNVVLLDDGLEDSDDDEEVALDAQFFKLHGSMEQNKRKEQFSGFRKAKKGILICTDVAARGIDVPQADHVIQYTGPQTDEDYIHRVGRTGRVDQAGTALIFLTHEEQEYVNHLREHKVFLKERTSSEFSNHLCDLMKEADAERAAVALQNRFQNAVSANGDLYKLACFAYSSWSRFYNSYPAKLRKIFNFQKVNLGHYVTSFAIKDTPSAVARQVKGHVAKFEPKRLNRKLQIHENTEQPTKFKQPQKRKIKSISLTTSEYASGLTFKKKKKN